MPETDATRRVEFTETPKKAWPDFKPVKGQIYDLPADQAARAVNRNVARYLDEEPILPLSDAEAKRARKDADATAETAEAAETARLASIARQAEADERARTEQAKAKESAQAKADAELAAAGKPKGASTSHSASAKQASTAKQSAKK